MITYIGERLNLDYSNPFFAMCLTDYVIGNYDNERSDHAKGILRQIVFTSDEALEGQAEILVLPASANAIPPDRLYANGNTQGLNFHIQESAN